MDVPGESMWVMGWEWVALAESNSLTLKAEHIEKLSPPHQLSAGGLVWLQYQQLLKALWPKEKSTTSPALGRLAVSHTEWTPSLC